MEMSFWLVLLITFVLGLFAAWISQFTAARKGIEANAKARALRQNVDSLIERNATRRDSLKQRQEVLDGYLMKDIDHLQGQLDDEALKSAIREEKARISSLTDAIKKSEDIIIENQDKLADIERKRSLNSAWLLLMSGAVGGATAGIFAFISYLGTVTDASFGFTHSVALTTSVIIQSLVLGAGWPLVWEKIFSVDRLESIASDAATVFQEKIREAEKNEV
jgi:hypothetical protein